MLPPAGLCRDDSRCVVDCTERRYLSLAAFETGPIHRVVHVAKDSDPSHRLLDQGERRVGRPPVHVGEETALTGAVGDQDLQVCPFFLQVVVPVLSAEELDRKVSNREPIAYRGRYHVKAQLSDHCPYRERRALGEDQRNPPVQQTQRRQVHMIGVFMGQNDRVDRRKLRRRLLAWGINGRLKPRAVFFGEKRIDQNATRFARNEQALMAQVGNGEHRREREYPNDLYSRQGEPPGSQIARWLFLKALGLIFFIAFASLFVQLKGLIGAKGILPAAELLSWAREQLGEERFLEVPTLFWLGASDWILQGLCAAGMLLSVLLMIGFAPRWIVLALWISYLSFASVCGIFLMYQWDILLLETAVMALFLAPTPLRPQEARGSPVWPGSIWLLRWLLLRLMVLSGLVKLL